MADHSAERRPVSANHAADGKKPVDRPADGNKSNRAADGKKSVDRAAYGKILLRYGILPDAATLSAMRMNRIEALMRISRRTAKRV